MAPCRLGSMRRDACCATKKPPNALTAIAFATSAGIRSTIAARVVARLHYKRQRPARRAVLDRGKQLGYIIWDSRITCIGRGIGFFAKRGELAGLPGCQRHADAFAGEKLANDALKPSPAPTINAVLYFMISMNISSSANLISAGRIKSGPR